RRDWRSFKAKERAALREIIGERIADLQEHPAKYTVTKEGSPLWSFVLEKIANTTPAVMLSDRKVGKDDFELSERLDDFDAPPKATSPTTPATPSEEDTSSLDDQLMAAISNGKVTAAKRLLRNGASPNAKWSSNGMPALCSAATAGNLEMVKLLVEKGADVNATDSTFGWTALQFAENELQHEEDNPGKYQAVIGYLQSR
ncbi:MAG: uncharacterized protein QOJ65_2324, partial [Fimbriimonadaceae bacterium]|nr:uncharacterized protein [Fimbriimonadaceae bacterium]